MSSESQRPFSIEADGHYNDPLFGRVWIKDTVGMTTGRKDLAGKYCNKLYTWLEIDMHGRAWMCCPSWLPYSIGNVMEDTLEEMWNGERAQKLRDQVFSGEWGYCQHSFCPEIASDNLPDIEWVKNNPKKFWPHEIQALETGSTISAELPTNINFSNDESCNLKCPSCRVDKILFTEGSMYDRRKQINDKIFDMLFSEPTDRSFSIFVTGSGDPFASKIYREMLWKIDGKDFPNLTVNMQTNGVMYTPKMWDSISKIHNNLGSCRISLDAGTKETYEGKTRLNGNWELLLSNCDFLDKKREQYPNFRIYYDFVVQRDNYKEMVQYAEMCLERFPNAEQVCFSLVTDWGTWKPEEYEQHCIWKESHPEHREFLRELTNPIFQHPRVGLGNLTALVNNAKRAFNE